MPRCCRAGGAPRRSSGRCSPQTPRPASASCRWTQVSTPVRCCCSGGSPLRRGATAGSLQEALARLGAAALMDVLAALEAGTQAPPVPQPAAGRHLRREDREGGGPDRLDPGGARDRAAGPCLQPLARRRDAPRRQAAADPRRASRGLSTSRPHKYAEKSRSWGYRRSTRRINGRSVWLGSAGGDARSSALAAGPMSAATSPHGMRARGPPPWLGPPGRPGAPALGGGCQRGEAVIDRGQSRRGGISMPYERSRARRVARRARHHLGTLRWYLRLAPALDCCSSGPPGSPRRSARSSSSRRTRWSTRATPRSRSCTRPSTRRGSSADERPRGS